MLGRADRQIYISDLWLEGRISKNSFWNMLREWALQYLKDEMFQPLYSTRGKVSIPPLYTFLAILIQFFKGYSDKEIEEASRFDDRVKWAITAPRDFEGIDAVTLCDHRKRLFCSNIGQKIFIDIIREAKESGMFDKDNLHVIDSFMVWGAYAKQDTYTMIYQGIKMTLKFIGFYGKEKEAKAQLIGRDYDSDNKKPEINWENKNEKEKLLDRLVKDAQILIKYARDFENYGDDLKEAVDLVEKIVLQDTEFDEKGMARISKGTKKDRTISINDPEMRHGRKTTSKKSDGYKAEIITGGKKGNLVVSVGVKGANVADGENMLDLIEETERNGVKIDKLYGDSAYNKVEEIKKKEEIEFCVKVAQASNATGCYTKDEFDIDCEVGKVTCPAGNCVEFDLDKLKEPKVVKIRFSSKICDKCELQDKCTKSKKGERTINLHPYEKELQEKREYQKTDEFKKDYAKRSNGERTISQITRHGGRKSRYKGKEKTLWQLTMVSIGNNIYELMKYLQSRCKNRRRSLTGFLRPKAA